MNIILQTDSAEAIDNGDSVPIEQITTFESALIESESEEDLINDQDTFPSHVQNQQLF